MSASKIETTTAAEEMATAVMLLDSVELLVGYTNREVEVCDKKLSMKTAANGKVQPTVCFCIPHANKIKFVVYKCPAGDWHNYTPTRAEMQVLRAKPDDYVDHIEKKLVAH